MPGPDHPFDLRDYDTRLPSLEPDVHATHYLDDDESSYNHIASSRSSSPYTNPPSPFSPTLYTGSGVFDLNRPLLPNRPILGYRQYQPHRVTPLSEPTELSLMDCMFQPKMPSPKLPDLSFDRLNLRLLDLTYPLPEPSPRFNVFGVTDPDHVLLARSRKPETRPTNPGMHKSGQVETVEDAGESLEKLNFMKQKLQGDLQVMNKKLKITLQHSAVDTCDSDPPSSPEVREVSKKDVPSPEPSVLSTHQTSSFYKTTVPVGDQGQNEAPKTIPEKGCTDPNRFFDFANRQHAWQGLSYAEINIAAKRRAVQKRTAKQVLDEVEEAVIQWQSRAEKGSTDLNDTRKEVQASSRLPLRGETIAPKVVSKKEPHETFDGQYAPQYSKPLAKKPKTSDIAEEAVSPKSAVTLYIEQAAAKYRDGLKPGLEPKEMSFSYDPMGSCLTPEQEATVKAEHGTSRTRVIAARLKALAAEADADAKWDNVDLSDEEDWEKVVGDDDGDWEVLEK